MKLAILAVTVFFQLSTAHAACLSRQEARKSYNGCVTYLNLSAPQQRRIAASLGSTRAAGIKACRKVARAGLQRVLANIDYYFCTSSSQDTSSSDDSPVCRFADDCKGGYCSASGRCMEGGPGARCDSSGQCANGYCDLSGRCN